MYRTEVIVMAGNAFSLLGLSRGVCVTLCRSRFISSIMCCCYVQTCVD